MVRKVTPEDLAAKRIVERRFSGGELFLRLRGEKEEVLLVCRCGRRHWLLRESVMEGSPVLSIVCHSCRCMVRLPLE